MRRDSPDDQHHTQRILSYPWTNQTVGESYVRRLLIFGPLLQVLSDKDNVIPHPVYLGDGGIKEALAKVSLTCLNQLFLIIGDCPVEFAQLLQAELKRSRLVGVKGLADPTDD